MKRVQIHLTEETIEKVCRECVVTTDTMSHWIREAITERLNRVSSRHTDDTPSVSSRHTTDEPETADGVSPRHTKPPGWKPFEINLDDFDAEPPKN